MSHNDKHRSATESDPKVVASDSGAASAAPEQAAEILPHERLEEISEEWGQPYAIVANRLDGSGIEVLGTNWTGLLADVQADVANMPGLAEWMRDDRKVDPATARPILIEGREPIPFPNGYDPEVSEAGYQMLLEGVDPDAINARLAAGEVEHASCAWCGFDLDE